MNRHALLFSNTGKDDFYIDTVKKDVQDFKNFLMDDSGGLWYENEIESLSNPSLSELQNSICKICKADYDYLIVYFSGHGDYERQTVLSINPDDDCIKEKDIRGLAARQLNIFDCCRAIANKNEGVVRESVSSLRKSFSQVSEIVRKRYDKRIMEAPPQEINLYSCSIGEYSQDAGSGGIYTQSLLYSARYLAQNAEDFVSVLRAHNFAKKAVIDRTENNINVQTPDFLAPRLPESQSLIIGMGLKHMRGTL